MSTVTDDKISYDPKWPLGAKLSGKNLLPYLDYVKGDREHILYFDFNARKGPNGEPEFIHEDLRTLLSTPLLDLPKAYDAKIDESIDIVGAVKCISFRIFFNGSTFPEPRSSGRQGEYNVAGALKTEKFRCSLQFQWDEDYSHEARKAGAGTKRLTWANIIEGLQGLGKELLEAYKTQFSTNKPPEVNTSKSSELKTSEPSKLEAFKPSEDCMGFCDSVSRSTYDATTEAFRASLGSSVAS